MNGDAENEIGQFASPACFMHEADPAYIGLSASDDRQQARDVARWRKAERERLIAARLAIPVATRTAAAQAIAHELDKLIKPDPGPIISVYFPFRGEPDLRPWVKAGWEKGMRFALPVVLKKGQPLIFREWLPDTRLERGVWNIPVPADGPEVTPQIVIAPLVGFDAACYRLGYGGGFFDRTLAKFDVKPVVIGAGYDCASIPTIYAQWHDVPMTWIVTETSAVKAEQIR